MKVLINTPGLELPGGVANYYNTIWQKFSVDVDYFTVGRRNEKESRSAVFWRFINDFWRFYRLLCKDHYDVVHLNPSLLGLSIIRDGMFHIIAKLMGKRTVIFVRGWDVKCERQIERWFMPLFRYAYFSVDAFIVLADEFKQFLREAGYAGPVYLETTVVDDAIFSDSATPCRQGASEGNKANLNILTLTRIEKTKGVYETIDAYHKLKRKYPFVTLNIAGDGPELQALKRYAHDQHIKDVTFLGFVSGKLKQAAFRQANIFLFPTSYGEGMPNALLEAMAYGLPVITRPVGGIRDFFENGRMGFVTESLDPNVFSEYLETLILDDGLRLQIGGFNRNYAREKFSAPRVVERLESIYRQVVGDLLPYL